MVRFPSEYVKTKFPGYYWNVETQELYTIKVTGVLRPMKKHKAFCGYANGTFLDIKEGYGISVNGIRRSLTVEYLKTLNAKVQPGIEVIEYIDMQGDI